MISSEKKNKRNGIIGTLLFHALLLISFLFMGLTYRIPPPPEEGISINFGFEEEGSNEIRPEDNSLESNPIIEEVLKESVEVEQEIITQETVETEVIEKPKETKKEIVEPIEPEEKIEEVIIEEPEPVVNTKALYTGSKKKEKQSDGNRKISRNQGSIEGDINSNKYEGGGIGVDGEAYQLLGRSVSFKAKPIYKVQLEGKVVVDITVDQLGNVVNAIAGVKGSTTLNSELLKRAKEAALKTKFSAKESAPTRQQGKIIYNFRLN